MKISVITRFWLPVIAFAVVIYTLGFSYTSIYQQGINFAVASEALAFTAGILIGCSFALSGLSYYLNIFDTKLKYRKYLGLLGYYLALSYSISLVIRYPDRYGAGLLMTLREPEALLGIGAMTILTLLAIISASWAIKALGSYWRPMLRLGYIAYLFLVIRALILEGKTWTAWGQSLDTLPPPRMILTLFALSIIYLRIVLEVDLRISRRGKSADTTAVVTTKP